MIKNIILFVKGFIMGIANIIPGVSGGTLAIILGIYEDFIGALSHFFKNFKKNLKLHQFNICGACFSVFFFQIIFDGLIFFQTA